MTRDLKPGEVEPDTTPAEPVEDLVRVHHPDLDLTKVVPRRRLPQMDPAWEVQEPEELRGEALDQALEDAGLPKTGTADEKRARLAEHEASTLQTDLTALRDGDVIENKEQ